MNGARGVIINVTGGPDLSLVEVSEASSIVQEAADEDANIIFGAVVDPTLKGKVKITVIATGFGAQRRRARRARRAHDAGRHDAVRRAAAAPRRADGAARPADRGSAVAAVDRAAAAARSAAGRAAAQPRAARRPLAAAGDGHGPSTQDAADRATTATPTLSSTFDVPAFLRRQEG